MSGAALAAILVLTGCATSEPPEDNPLRVAGELGHPVIVDTARPAPSEPTDEVAIVGEGRRLVDGSYVLYTISSFDEMGKPLLKDNAQLRSGVINADFPYRESVIDATEGSRIILTRPQDNGVETIIIDLLHTQAFGTSEGAPKDISVTTGDDGGPILQSGVPVDSLSSYVLIRGEGVQIASGDAVYAQYQVYRAEDGEQIDSTWSEGPRLIDLSGVFPGLATAVTDARIGSRLLVLVPAAEARGTADLVIIVDLLARDDTQQPTGDKPAPNEPVTTEPPSPTDPTDPGDPDEALDDAS